MLLIFIVQEQCTTSVNTVWYSRSIFVRHSHFGMESRHCRNTDKRFGKYAGNLPFFI